MFGVIINQSVSYIVMDDDDDVVCIKVPVGTRSKGRHAELLATEGPSESVLMVKVRNPHLLIRSEKIKKQQRAPREYVLRREWKVVRSYATGSSAQLDEENINFDVYKRARELMELSSMIMLPEQEGQAGCLHLWTLIRQASTASNGYAVRKYA